MSMKKNTQFKIAKIILLVLMLVFILSSCMPGPNDMRNIDLGDKDKKVAGFWNGLWHGFIAFISFIVSLFNKNVNIYEVYNNGGWYNFGFILGVMMAFGSSGAGSRTVYCRKKKKIRIDED